MNDTIFALSSGHGKAGVAVIRISGADLRGMVAWLLQGGVIDLCPRHAYLADLRDANDELVDKAIIIYFPAPNSFNGEDIVEIHCHGSTAVITKIFDMLKASGARMAEPGEFARRAFQNNKMDLVEIDGLAALLDARTEKQRAAAIRVATGVSSDVYMKWRNSMIEIAAYSAAMLDYPADELPANIGGTIMSRIQELHNEIGQHLSRAARARSIRAGFNIALVGDVNVGKSSLFNRLVGESRAIVSDTPGTTRDVVHAEIDIDGYLVRLLDTAGLRDTKDTVEKMGIKRTQDAIENADLVIRVIGNRESGVGNRKDSDNEITVYNKCDLDDFRLPTPDSRLFVSALTGVGIDELLARIRTEVHARLDGAESDTSINARVATALNDAVAELKNALNVGVYRIRPNESVEQGVCDTPLQSDLVAEHVRRAADAVGRVLGVIGVDEVADATFGQLCLGK